MKQKRGERRAKTESIIKRRVRVASAALIFGIGRVKKGQPHRVHKHKPKFTGDHGSLKQDKKLANRAARKRARQALISGKEMPAEPKESVRYNYW